MSRRWRSWRWQLDAVIFHVEADKKDIETLQGFASRVCLVHRERERELRIS
jgi:hypothetical protein